MPGSPFPVNVTEGSDASKVKAYGPGLEQGVTNQPAKFTVDTRGAGSGGLALLIEGPSDAKVTTIVSVKSRLYPATAFIMVEITMILSMLL